MKLGSASRLGNPFSRSNLVLCCKSETHKELCCTDGGCRGTWQKDNGSALAMREATEVSQSLEDTHSLQLISKKQSEKCHIAPEEWTSLGRCLQCLTVMRSLVQDKLKMDKEWLLGYRKELKETEYFRNFCLVSCFLKSPLLPSYIPQF